jgi:hypothetical protein
MAGAFADTQTLPIPPNYVVNRWLQSKGSSLFDFPSRHEALSYYQPQNNVNDIHSLQFYHYIRGV